MTIKTMLVGVTIFLQGIFLSSNSHADSSTQKDEKFFSLTELENQAKKELRPLLIFDNIQFNTIIRGTNVIGTSGENRRLSRISP